MVIGADGVHSRVRETLGLTSKLVNLRDGCGRHLIPRTADDPVHIAMEEWSGGRRIGVVPSSPEWTYIFLCGPESDIGCNSPYAARSRRALAWRDSIAAKASKILFICGGL